MSHSSRRILLGAVLACCFFVGSLAPAASEAKVTNKDLLEMDQKILGKLGATQDLLKEVNDNVDDVLPTVGNLSGKLDQALTTVGNLSGNLDQALTTVRSLSGNVEQVLTIVGNLSGNLDQVLTIVGNLSGKLDQVLTIVGNLTGEVADLLNPIICQLLGICPSGASSP